MTPRAAAPIALLAVVVAAGLPAAAATQGVRVGSFYFEDSSSGDGQVIVTQGDRITFSFEDSQHTATVDGMFDSGVKSPGQTYTTGALTRSGTFTLYCQVHGTVRHSTKLVIRANPSPSPSPTTARPSPSPSPTKAQPSPSRTTAPSPSRRPTASPSPRVTLTPSPSAKPSPSLSTSPSSSPSPSPSPSAVRRTTSPSPPIAAGPVVPEASPSDTPDVVPAAPIHDDDPSWGLPAGILVGLMLLGAAAIALGRRRQIQ